MSSSSDNVATDSMREAFMKALQFEVRKHLDKLLKLELKARSGSFRLLNGIINPYFDRIRNSLLSPEELAESRRKAKDL